MVGADQGRIVTVLVTGRSGQLAADLVPELERRGHQVVATSRRELDLRAVDRVDATVREIAPTLIINTAADTDVDGCEAREASAHLVNAEAVGALAEAARAVGAHLVTLSTDYVFDGTKADPYVESDGPNPRSAYGRTKLAGERMAGPDATVVRTAWLSGAGGPNIVRTVLRLLEGDGPLRFVTDQRGAPTFTSDLARAVADLAEARSGGVFHLTNAGSVSWFEFVRSIAEHAGADPSRVEPITTAELDPPRPAPRPANSVLDNAAWRALGGEPLRDYESALIDLLAELR